MNKLVKTIGSLSVLVLILSGFSLRLLFGMFVVFIAFLPLGWKFMHEYQKERVLSLINPYADPLGAGYHAMQAKKAIGSGGLFGKGYLHGTQTHLLFLPAGTTDFAFAVLAEEFGFVGCLVLLLLFVSILLRCVLIFINEKNDFLRLLSGGLSFSFFAGVIVNIGMSIGLLPVVGVPLSIISYGGSSMFTMMLSLGIIMSIKAHKITLR